MRPIVPICLLAGLIAIPSSSVHSQETDFDWRTDWEVKEGFSIDIDTEGYHLPTAIAFVPNPGDKPKDPLYFVTELRGKVKVITNDRTIIIFADDFFALELDEEIPEDLAEVGLAGICLEPENGYVFVTFAYEDENKVLRNNIVRFQTEPKKFSTAPTSQLAFTEILITDESALSHQIGPCQISRDLLYVSVGDGRQYRKSQEISSTLGKVIRMTLDGSPAPNNPFRQEGNVESAANYVWALGLRNPFGLRIVNDRVFVADNGNDVDRFLEIQAGENYLWNGSDWAIGTNADAVLSPGVAPVQMDYYPDRPSGFPDSYQQHFFIAASGDLAGIVTVEYGFEESKVLSVPEYFLQYRGEVQPVSGATRGAVSGLAFGPDGLYFAPIFPNEAGLGAVFRIIYDPDRQHPFILGQNDDPVSLLTKYECLGCHSLNNAGGTAAPPLDREVMLAGILARLDSEEYTQTVRDLDIMDEEPFRSYERARQEVMEASGLEKVRIWITYHIQEPKFDSRFSQMPNLGVSETEARIITDYLLAERTLGERISSVIDSLSLPRPRYQYMVYTFVVGFVLAAALAFGLHIRSR